MLKHHNFVVQVPFKEGNSVDSTADKRVLLKRSLPRDFSEYSEARKRLADSLRNRTLYGLSAGVAPDCPKYVLEQLPKELRSTLDLKHPWYFTVIVEEEKKADEMRKEKRIEIPIIEWLYDFETKAFEVVAIDEELLEELVREDPVIRQLETEVKLTYSGYTYIESVEEGERVFEEHKRLNHEVGRIMSKYGRDYEKMFSELVKVGFKPLTPYSIPEHLFEKNSKEEWQKHLECRNLFEKPFSDEISFLLNFRFLGRERGVLAALKKLFFRGIDIFLFVYEKSDVERDLRAELEECSEKISKESLPKGRVSHFETAIPLSGRE